MRRDYRGTQDVRARQLLVRWLRSLPPAGWAGTPTALADELAAFAVWPEPTFTNGGRVLAEFADVLEREGWKAVTGRTKAGRWVRVERAAG